MKKLKKLLKSRQSGMVLIYAMILLAVGSLVLVPLLVFMQSGMNAGEVVEDKVGQTYAADAGVEDAIWKIKNRDDIENMPKEEGDPPYPTYTIADVNGYSVEISISLINLDNGGTYQVLSDAGETRVDAIIDTVWIDYSYFLERVITSGSGIEYPEGNQPEIIPDDPSEPGYDENGPIYDFPSELWPTAEEMLAFYLMSVDTVEDLYDSGTLNVRSLSVPRTIGPLYRDGNLNFTNSGGGSEVYAQLTGTVLITGNMDMSPSKLHIDLNGQTIFVGGDIDNIGPGVTFNGSGCIIAVGDIDFQPHIDSGSSPDDFIFLMSIEGTTSLQPQNDFYGAIAGNVEVDLKPGSSITYIDPPEDGLNFPEGGEDIIWGIHTWQIEYKET